ncbi:MAG: hypothetical protein IT459_18330 [Planctomycetes bacterium]|nr:hypothetical protein [Planctomycetota bacterium]
MVGTSVALAGGNGFANKPGGGFNDPIIQIDASRTVDPLQPFNLGQSFTRTESQLNDAFRFDAVSDTFKVNQQLPTIPPTAAGVNQFIRITFPFAIHSKKVRKSLVKVSATTAATSYLTSNIEITDQNGNHISGIPVINGRDPFNVKVFNTVGFPQWLDSSGKNQLVGKNRLAYIASLPTDTEVQSVAAFGGTTGDPETVDAGVNEIRVRIHKVGKTIINGFWVLKIGDGAGLPKAAGTLTITNVEPKSPVVPAQLSLAGDPVVESFSRYVVRFSEPVVPRSVGFSADYVEKFNASNPIIPLLYNGNTGLVPNPNDLLVSIVNGMILTATPNNLTGIVVPTDIRPINPNNFSEYVIDPLVEVPPDLDVNVVGIRLSALTWPTNDPTNPTMKSVPTTLYNAQFDDAATATATFHSSGKKTFTNAPVAPQAIYYNCLSGTGMGAINLDGNGFETNDPATSKVLLLTNLIALSTCTTSVAPPGASLLGCNPNTFGDTGTLVVGPPLAYIPPTAPVGLGNNPVGHLGGPTPLPGINEGSTGSTAAQGNPNTFFGSGFETVVKTSSGDPRLVRSPKVGSIGDVAIGDFLDTLFFDTTNPFAANGLHGSLNGTALNRNSISDPPTPNPPPLAFQVGLPPVDVVFSKQDLLKPAFVIEGSEVFPAIQSFFGRIHLLQNTAPSFGQGDRFPTIAQAGPQKASFTAGPAAFGSRQQIGNFLYVTDRDQGKVQVLNSNNFSIIDSIKLPDPEGLGLSPDLRRLYVTNYGDDTVSIIGTDPFGPFFHEEINRLKTANGPRAVSAQTDGEDVFICNYLGNSISILSPVTQTVRKTISDANIKRPVRAVLTPRQLLTGWTAGIYFGYILCNQSEQVVVYESGPSGTTGIGFDDVRWVSTGTYKDIRGGCYDPGSYPGAVVGMSGGVYLAHRDPDTGMPMVSRIAFTSQQPAPGPQPILKLAGNTASATDRAFTKVGTWGGPLVPFNQRLNYGGQDQSPYDVALADFRTQDFFSSNPLVTPTNFGSLTGLQSANAVSMNNRSPIRIVQGAPIQANYADRMYVSFPGDDLIEVLDANNAGIKLNTITGVPRVASLTTFWD